MPRKRNSDAEIGMLREFGLAYPGAHTKSPWPGHLDLAVNDKTFAYMSTPGEPFRISCKLPHSAATALMLESVKPAPYGLGKSGWVSASFGDGNIPVAMLKEWIDESYRAQAPKRFVAALDGAANADVAAPAKKRAAPAKKRTPKKKPKQAAPR